MRKPDEKKTIRKTILMTENTDLDIKREAMERGIKANAVMNERLNHSKSDNTPSKMVQFQNYANMAVEMIAAYSEADAKILEEEANKLWIF